MIHGQVTFPERKKLVFDSLYALDHSSADEDDPGMTGSIQAFQGQSITVPAQTPPVSAKESLLVPYNYPPRPHQDFTQSTVHSSKQISKPRKASAMQLLNDAEAVKETPLGSLRTNTIVVGDDVVKDSAVPLSIGAPSSAIPRAMGKRKRGADVETAAVIKCVPKGQDIFDGLHFYFFPNDDTNPGRRMRIIKSIEYGATWQKKWNSSITHLVVDEKMKWDDVAKYLTIKEGPAFEKLLTNVVVVNQSYPADCIMYRYLMRPFQRQHLVQGYVPRDEPISSPLTTAESKLSQASGKSLQLKPPGKAVIARPQSTPSRTEESPSVPSATSESNEGNSGDLKVNESAIDTLDAAIREVKENEHLASEWDQGDDEGDRDGDNDEENGCDEPLAHHMTSEEQALQCETPTWQDRFQCMHKHIGDKNKGPNTETIILLQQMADYYTQIKDDWRQRAYRSAIAALRKHDSYVATKAEALRLNGIGDSIAEKIEEIVVSKKLRKLDYAKLDPRQKILQTFMKVYSAGYMVADKWIGLGYRTLKDLRRNPDLTPNQVVGIDHYDHFNARIPRGEVERHANIVRTTLQGLDQSYQVRTMGSYRRGADNSGDIDLIITKPGAPMSEIRNMVTETLIPMLFKSSFLTAELAQTSAADGTSWHGACCLPGAHIWRRIDFLLVPDEELGAALIYFTGNDIFNRSLRLLASKKGMRLNQRGLYRDVMRGPGRLKMSEGQLVEGRSEEKIFRALGVPFRPPEHRIC